jgi:hypothetical protein
MLRFPEKKFNPKTKAPFSLIYLAYKLEELLFWDSDKKVRVKKGLDNKQKR